VTSPGARAGLQDDRYGGGIYRHQPGAFGGNVGESEASACSIVLGQPFCTSFSSLLSAHIVHICIPWLQSRHFVFIASFAPFYPCLPAEIARAIERFGQHQQTFPATFTTTTTTTTITTTTHITSNNDRHNYHHNDDD
jgi:hypothetical protein